MSQADNRYDMTMNRTTSPSSHSWHLPDEEKSLIGTHSTLDQPSSSLVRFYRLLLGLPVLPAGFGPVPKYTPNGDRFCIEQQRAPAKGEMC